MYQNTTCLIGRASILRKLFYFRIENYIVNSELALKAKERAQKAFYTLIESNVDSQIFLNEVRLNYFSDT